MAGADAIVGILRSLGVMRANPPVGAPPGQVSTPGVNFDPNTDAPVSIQGPGGVVTPWGGGGGGSGDVNGPAASVDNELLIASGTTGKVLKRTNTLNGLVQLVNGVVTMLSAAAAKTFLALTSIDVGLGNVTNESKATMFTNAALTGVSTTPTAAPGTNTTQIASTAFIQAAIAAAVVGLLDFKGALAAAANPNYPAGVIGDSYAITSAGRVGGGAGKQVDIGDMVVCSADNAGGTEASVGTSWFVLEHNLAGALLSANNLSDLASTATAWTNLGADAKVRLVALTGIDVSTKGDVAAATTVLAALGFLQATKATPGRIGRAADVTAGRAFTVADFGVGVVPLNAGTVQNFTVAAAVTMGLTGAGNVLPIQILTSLHTITAGAGVTIYFDGVAYTNTIVVGFSTVLNAHAVLVQRASSDVWDLE